MEDESEMEGLLNGYSKIMAFDIYISNIFRSYILHNGFLIKPKNSTLLISSHEPSPLMKQGTNMMYGCKEPHDAWMGIISIDRYQPCLPHPLWSFNNPSNNKLKYRICDMQHLQNAYAIYHNCGISHMRFVNVAYHICDI